MTSDQPIEVQAYVPGFDGYVVTGGTQAGTYSRLTAEQQAQFTAATAPAEAEMESG